MKSAKDYVIKLLNNELNEKKDYSFLREIDEKTLIKVLKIAEKSQIVPFISSGIKDELKNEQWAVSYIKDLSKEDGRYFRDYVLKQCCIDEIDKLFNDYKIKNIPIKGAVLNKLYPEPWKRRMVDVDILIHRENLNKAIKLLITKCNYKRSYRWYHDVLLVSPNGVHLELHFSLEDDIWKKNRFEKNIWENEHEEYKYKMDNTVMYYYILAHAYKHYSLGQSCLRHLLDFYLLYRRTIEEGSLDNILNEKKKFLTKNEAVFHNDVIKLFKCWFYNEKQYEEEVRVLENRIIFPRPINIEKIKKETSVSKKVFLPFNNMKIHYKILEKLPFLYPCFIIYRLVDFYVLKYIKKHK